MADLFLKKKKIDGRASEHFTTLFELSTNNYCVYFVCSWQILVNICETLVQAILSVRQDDFFREIYGSQICFRGFFFLYFCLNLGLIFFSKLKGFRLKLGFKTVCFDGGRLCALNYRKLFINLNATNLCSYLTKNSTFLFQNGDNINCCGLADR